MADTADVKVKDIGSRPVGYTIADESGPVDLRFDTEKDATDCLNSMKSLVPPLMTSGRVVAVRGVIKERRGGPGRKSNAQKAAEQAANGSPTAQSAQAQPTAKAGTPASAKG